MIYCSDNFKILTDFESADFEHFKIFVNVNSFEILLQILSELFVPRNIA